MTGEDIKKIIEENPVALATLNLENKPYVIGVACVKLRGDKVVITDNYMQSTISNIKKNSNVSLVCWDKDLEGVNIQGEAEYFTQGEWLDYVKQIPGNKDRPYKGAIVIKINNIKKSK